MRENTVKHLAFSRLPFYQGPFTAGKASKSALFDIQPQTRLTGIFIRSMTGVALVGQNGLDLKIEVYNFREIMVSQFHLVGQGGTAPDQDQC